MRSTIESISRWLHGVTDFFLINFALLFSLAVGIVIIVIRYAHFSSSPSSALSLALIWAGACLISGVAVGFLFGIPRVFQGADQKGEQSKKDLSTTEQREARGGPNSAYRAAYRQEVNTNLLEISDWLTKIIVGLSLVNLKQIPTWVDSSATLLARGLAGCPGCKKDILSSDHAFASALIVGFSVLGFLMGYLYTRLFLAGAFFRADAPTQE
jgi:hypothetical protein